MRWLIFLSKVAFLSGVMLVLAFSLMVFNWNRDEPVSSGIIAAGYGLALILVPLINLLYFWLAITGKKIGQLVPRWIIAFNIICLLMLILYYSYINGYINFKG